LLSIRAINSRVGGGVSLLTIILGILTLVPYAIIWFFFAFAEYLDWRGRMEIIQKEHPKVWKLMNDRPFRLVLLLFVFALLAADFKENLKQIESEPPVVRISAPQAPVIEVASMARAESPNSLRRRTIKLADEYYDFKVKRQRGQKGRYVDKPTTDDEQKARDEWNQYWRETEDLFFKLYSDRFVQIVREYSAKGIPTGFLEISARQRSLQVIERGAQYEGVPQVDDLGQFRDLAYRVDADGNPINF
jgi:hypothetical protein